MPSKSFLPTTPTLRYKTCESYDDITTTEPYKPLLVVKKRSGGRNSTGHITSRHRGGGHKRFIRTVDFRRNKHGINGSVETIEYDPNRSCRIALIKYADGERRYILASVNMKVGQVIISNPQCEITEGNHMMLRHVPPGIQVHNIELEEGKGGQIARTAGAYAQVVAKENNMVQLRFPSSEIRNVRETCFATIGQVGNADHMNTVLGSAGRKRWLGRRPRVRGVAMNPIDHPLGGGEGRSAGGRHPCSPWGQKAKGLKTRTKKKLSGKYIVRRRNDAKSKASA